MTQVAAIEDGVQALGLQVDAAVRAKMLAHLELVEKWNRVHNLTSVREPAQMVTLHLLDSLSLLPHLGNARRVADIGTGAGFPGVPLALARPQLHVALVESSHKKGSFLQQAKAELGIPNVEVVCQRVEQWRPAEPFDAVISRAFAELVDFVAQAGHLVAPGGRMLAMKGIHPYEEIARLPASHRVKEVLELKVPGLDAKRHLVVLEAA
jgi:16S rRNA (guanine527-N7)-methyltransferase